jgi:catechol 2,3-dioxygenase-like lactoylglutathione lyase family enzyme
MAEIKGIAHFSIPVSDVDKSTIFYTEIVRLQIPVRAAG